MVRYSIRLQKSCGWWDYQLVEDVFSWGPNEAIADLIVHQKTHLKGQSHKKFWLYVFSTKHFPQPTDSYTKAFSNINLNSPRNLNLKPIPRCGPPWRIDFFLQARADHKHECHSLWVVLFQTFFTGCPFKGACMFWKRIIMILWCGL
jgi:hypothetical protein